MGVIIRYIHNRDLAAENIMTAIVRQRLVLDLAPGAVCGLLERLQNLGVPLPYRSSLSLAGEVARLRGSVPGAYALELRESRRNSRKFFFDEDVCALVRGKVRDVLELLKYPPAYKPVQPSPGERGEGCVAMIAGVILNGRRYAQGSHCEYLPWVPVSYRNRARGILADGPGGWEGSSTSRKICTVHMFYTFNMQGPGPKRATFVAITDRPVLSRARSLSVISWAGERDLKPGFDFEMTDGHELIHIDSITWKVKLAPHFNSDLATAGQACAIPIWESR